MLSRQEMQSLQRRLMDAVCPVCIHNSVDGTCALWSLEECPISSHLTRLTGVVQAVQSNLMEDYVARIRQDVCSVCRSAEFHNQACDMREEGQCALDAYLSLIVDTIDDFLKERDSKAPL